MYTLDNGMGFGNLAAAVKYATSNGFAQFAVTLNGTVVYAIDK